MSVCHLEGGDSHDEIIHELIGKSSPASVHVIVPLIINYLVLFGILYVDLVEDDLAEVDVGDPDSPDKSGVEEIYAGRNDSGRDMELYWLTIIADSPKTGHEEDDYVGGERRGEGVEGACCSLLRVVDVLSEIGEARRLRGDVDLRGEIGTIGPEE